MKLLILFILAVACVGSCKSETCADNNAETKNAIHLSSGRAKISHYSIVLMGATGNLAAKYLWNALYGIFLRQYSKDSVYFQIYAVSRSEPESARRKISRQLLSLVDCGVETANAVDSDCVKTKTKFIESISYQQLKTERDFKTLGEKLYANTQSIYGIEPGSPNTYESGRLIYMSIPPSTYAATAKYTDQYLRPKIGRPWFRVVIEKPFGHDINSAKKLAADLKQYFHETELYRIDHYLAKTVIKQILPFRYRNRDSYEPMWNREYIEQVDIVMKEKEDVAGRIDFYNDVGVIRDVMQNHMTEMLALVTTDLPDDSGNISSLMESKLRLLKSVRSAAQGAVLTGQYTTYNIEWWRSQQQNSNESAPAKNISHTPTFAAVVLNVNNDRWRGVPFVLLSGKKLDEKASYIRVRFRANRFCLRASSQQRDDVEPQCGHSQHVVFRVGDGSLQKSLIAVSKGLPITKEQGRGWSLDADRVGTLFGQNSSQTVRYVADAETDPYLELIEAVMAGSRHLFVSTDSLLAAWNIWTDILDEANQMEPRLYMGGGKDPERLDFLVAPPGSIPPIKYWVSEVNVLHFDVNAKSAASVRQVPDTFRNSILESGIDRQVIDKLAREILDLATNKISRDQNSQFHLAMSGGRTPEMLLRQLASAPLPWERVHVWMVDERCDGSNFETIEHHLLSRNTGLKHRNIHPMLRDFHDNPCDPSASNRVDHLYEATIRRLVPDNSFDFVVLGVGSDGHTASLFPGHLEGAVEGPENLVKLVQIGFEQKQQRVTLTFNAINSAKRIAILVLGHEKNTILRQISDQTVDDVDKYPITGVAPGITRWYVDYDALLGKDSA